jgi:hypothetical protein
MVSEATAQNEGFPPQADQCSDFSAAAGRGAARQIEKETLKKRITNIEQGIMNIEVRYSIIIIF